MLTTQEVQQYIRLTLKQWNLTGVEFAWIESDKVRGLAYGANRIELATNCLVSFRCFRETLLHEIAHLLDYRERGTYVVNVYKKQHGKNWKKWCKTLGIPARLKIPA